MNRRDARARWLHYAENTRLLYGEKRHHGDYVRDPLAVARGIYARFDLELAPAVEQAMRDWVAAHPQGQHGEHRYDLETYGLSEDLVREAFAAYIEEYGPFARPVVGQAPCVPPTCAS